MTNRTTVTGFWRLVEPSLCLKAFGKFSSFQGYIDVINSDRGFYISMDRNLDDPFCMYI